MRIIKKFKAPYLCPYNNHNAINPYTNCSFGCMYCYGHMNNESKSITLQGLEMELMNNKGVIEIGTYTDAYQTIEKSKKLMRTILKELIKHPSTIVINTKSDLILRDLDLLKELSNKTAVSIGISINKLSNNNLDGNSPRPSKRINTLKELLNNNLNAYLRYDPIIPYYNDDEDSITEVLNEFANTNLRRITVSTYKPVSWEQVKSIDKALKLNGELIMVYKKGTWVKGSLFLPEQHRQELINKFNNIARDYGFIVSACREGFMIGLCDNIKYNS